LVKNELTTLSAVDAAAKIASGALSSEQYVQTCLTQIAARDGDVRAFVHIDPNYAIQQARARDKQKSEGGALGVLHGIPVAVKDIFDTVDFPTENGTKLDAGRKPARDAEAVARLRAAGAVILGKTVTTECAYFFPGATRNPHDLARTPGGSSSGSAAAIAAGMVPLAIGSQTNGSVIRPAAFCGVIGMKPSHGLVSRARVLALSGHLDHVGVFANLLSDIVLAMGVLAGNDPDDPDTNGVAKPNFTEALSGSVSEPRLAFVRTPVWDKADAYTRNAFENLAKQLGGAIVEIKLPDRFADAWPAHRTIMAVDMAKNLGEAVERGGEQKSSEILRKLMAEGRTVQPERYRAAIEEAESLSAMFDEQFKDFDGIVTPATIGVAPSIETTGDPVFCSLWSLLGVPAISLPLLMGEGGLPLGVQLVARKSEDARLLGVANWLTEKFKRV
jgi:Asp-tRNA(Asn)/Glu-tRNA(Gln) amidotransferase A subunit family amidase